LEEGSDESSGGFAAVEVELKPLSEGLILMERSLGQSVGLHMVPDELVGIEVGGVAREEIQLQAPLEALDVLGDPLGGVGRMAVQDQDHLRPAPSQKGLEQGDKALGVEPLGVDLVPEGALSSAERRAR
jgi:hypothetical protein